MKKIIILLGLVLLGNVAFCEGFEILSVPAAECDCTMVLTGSVDFDWVDISPTKREERIKDYQKEVFTANLPNYDKKSIKEDYKTLLKDKKNKEHYAMAKAGITETDDAEICAFFYKNSILLVYAVKYKDDPRKVLYYDAYGRLQYIDVMSENYPNFPYVSKQFRVTGHLVSAIYFVSKDLQYMYEPDQKFKGVWYKEKMFDRDAKHVLTRTNW